MKYLIFLTTATPLLFLLLFPLAFADEKDQSIKLLAPIGQEKEFTVPKYEEQKPGYSIQIIEAYIAKIYPYAAVIIASLTVFMTVVGALEIITAADDSAKVTAGRDRIMYAILGLILFLFASVILWTINPNFFTWS